MHIMFVNNILQHRPYVLSIQDQARLFLPLMAYVLTFVIANTFLNIITASQDTEKGYQTSGAANAVVFILTFRVYFVCGVK